MKDSKRILITGGTSGIGLALAKVWLEQGHRVAVVGRSVETAVRELASYGSRAKAYSFDLAVSSAAQELRTRYLADFGGIDVLVNNAGYATYETFLENSWDETERLLQVNLLAHVRVTKAFIGDMTRQRAGQIVNISSIAGEIVLTPSALYMASKQAVNAWSRALSYELAAHGIEVKVICPGRVDTPFFSHPTFRRRRLRPEMKKSIPVDVVARGVAEALDRKGFLFYFPRHYAWIAWCYKAIPLVERCLFGPMNRARALELETQNWTAKGLEHGNSKHP